MSAWSIDLCRSWERITTVTDYTFNAKTNRLAAGGFVLEVPAASLSGFGTNGGMSGGEQTTYGPANVDTIRVVRDGVIVFAGMVQSAGDAGIGGAGGFEQSTDGASVIYRWSGPDLWGVLASRLAYPDPTSNEPWVTAYDYRSGLASTVAAAYVHANLGAGAIATRRWGNLIEDDQPSGNDRAWSARLQPLDQLVARICADGGVGCWPTVRFDGTVVVQFGPELDRSDRVVLSDQDDVTSLDLRIVPPTATYAIGGGADAGTSRTFRSVSSGASGTARREVFLNQSAMTSDELFQAAYAAVLGGAQSYAVTGEVADQAASQLNYLTDYRVGDWVSVNVAYSRFKTQVTAVTFELTGVRQIVKPVLGTAAPSLLEGLVRDVSDLQADAITNIA